MPESELFSQLQDINFAQKEPQQIESEIIKVYEQITGRTLARADPVRLFLNAIILVIIQQRNIIDHTAKQNLLAYSSGDYLEHLGALLGVTRLSASHAACTARFSLSEAQKQVVLIPKGLRITPGNNIYFQTVNAAEIKTGNLFADIPVQCTEAGIIGNGYTVGQIKKLVDVFPYEMTVENISESNGGSEIESDENLRERIQIAPESFSTAGSSRAYEFFARSAHSDICSVSVVCPPVTEPGHVKIYPLMTGGIIPSSEVIQAVYNACNADDVRPDTDYVQVLSPVEIKYNLEIGYWIDEINSSLAGAIQLKVENAIKDWIQWQRSALGRDINPSELIHRVVQAGAKRAVIAQPVFKTLEKWQIAAINTQRVVYNGFE